MGSKLDQAKAQIVKQFGEGSIMSLDEEFLIPIERTPTGALSLDIALGGGLPRGRIIEAYGPESSGKTTVALHAIAEAQRQGLVCAFIDAEHALDPVYAQAIGVQFNNTLLFSQPDSGEQALEIALTLTETGEVGFIVIDSVAALTPQAEINGDIGDSHVGLQARLMSQALRKMNGPAQKNGTTLFFINQLREKIGVMFGSPEVTPGGRALKFYSSVRLDVRRKDQIKDGTEVTGNLTVVKVVKNKTAPPFRTAEFDIVYGKGISKEGCILDVAEDYGLLKKKGAWYADIETDTNIGQGREKAKLFLEDNPEYAESLYNKIMEQI